MQLHQHRPAGLGESGIGDSESIIARHWRTTIAIRIPIGRRANSSSSVTGFPLIVEKKIILIRVSIKKRKVAPHQLINFVNIPGVASAYRGKEEVMPEKSTF
jgi:hypothetical protein